MTPTVSTPAALRRHEEWMAAATAEYALLVELLRTLDADDWSMPTDCDGWAVRDIVAHVIGAADYTARVREAIRQSLLGRKARGGGDLIDGINAVQVTERAALSPADLLAALPPAAERGLAARRRLPGVVRAMRVPFGPPLGLRSVGYLMDRIYTRDAWLHRIDISRALGRELTLSDHHDGALVADVVHEWARKHREPFTLLLDGVAGGVWSVGNGGAALRLDAIEFVRTLSGRTGGDGLLAVTVPF